MSDEQIVEYCRKMIVTNLNQYDSNMSNPKVVIEICELNSNNDELLLEHCKGVKKILEKCIEILEKKQRLE